jgi:DNA mismatch repair protein MutS2
MFLDSTTSVQLGWNDVCAALAGETSTPQGARMARSLLPSDDLGKIRTAQARHSELSHWLQQGTVPPLETIAEAEDDLVRAEKNGTLTPDAIRNIALGMIVSSRVREYIGRSGAGTGTALRDLARGSHDLLDAGRGFIEAFDPSGALRDSASPELSAMRKSSRHLADGIRSRLEQMLRGPKASCFMEPIVTQRTDRFVLLVRMEAQGSVPGIVHDTSQSGATLFIEPTEVVDDGNRLKIVRAAVFEEEQKILRGYTREIADLAGMLRENLEMTAQFDVVYASCRLAQKMGASLASVDGNGFDLKSARHPLMCLESMSVVENDIRLPKDGHCLIITGPNAGGKTVALKTFGLLVMMTQAGLAIPAGEGSRLGLFSSIHAVIGDEQDLRRGLSTFSAHIERLTNILKQARPGSLVLLDELAADTEPRHGAALARAILKSLVDHGIYVCLTTHYEELTQLPFSDFRFANAAVGFDAVRLKPTFVLHPDTPGRSFTMDIARRLNVPEDILRDASENLEPSDRRLDEALSSLELEKSKLASLSIEQKRLIEETRASHQKQEAAARDLEKTRTELLQKGKKQLLPEFQRVRDEVAEIMESLKRNPSMKQAVAASRQLKSIESELREADSVREDTHSPAVLEPGDRVLVRSLQQTGRVTAFDAHSKMATVSFGSIQTRVAEGDVVPMGHSTSEKKPPRSRPMKAAAPSPKEPMEVRSAQNTLDVRGLRADEAIDTLDKFLDSQFAAAEIAVFIIHGHGTGALKSSIRKYLRESPYSRAFRVGAPEEGGDGITVVRLK